MKKYIELKVFICTVSSIGNIHSFWNQGVEAELVLPTVTPKVSVGDLVLSIPTKCELFRM